MKVAPIHLMNALDTFLFHLPKFEAFAKMNARLKNTFDICR